MAMLDIINLRTHFPSPDGLVKAVDAVDLQIEKRERLGLIGETGCGKTVLGMSIIRLLQPSTRVQGRIIYKGRDLLELKEEEMRLLRGKEIAMILQNPTTSLNPVLKVGDQIAEVLQLHMGLDKEAGKSQSSGDAGRNNDSGGLKESGSVSSRAFRRHEGESHDRHGTGRPAILCHSR